MSVLDRLQSILDHSLGRHGLPGASLAVLADGVVHEAAAGVVNTLSGQACTPDSLFMFGSVTKTLTATMVLRLVEQGRLGLDDLAADRVPEFAPQDRGLGETIRLRHLLSHSSGLVGSIFQDTGRNPDALARQVELINTAPAYHRPGALLSYCNSGYLVLGRAIEVATGGPWDAAVQSLAAAPLGADLVTRPEQALRHGASVGHVMHPTSDAWIPVAEPFAMPAHGPAGSTLAGRARDLVRLAEGYMKGALIGPGLAREAWSIQAPALAPEGLKGWGLGWMIFDWDGTRVIGHDGSTAGTKAYLRIAPDKGVAVALLVNAQAGLPVYEDVMGAVFGELTGAWETLAPAMPRAPVSAMADCIGAFGDSHLRLEVSVSGEEAKVTVMPNATNPIHRHVMMAYPVQPCGPGSFFATGAAVIFYPPARDLTCDLVKVSTLAKGPCGEDFLCNGANIYRRIERAAS